MAIFRARTLGCLAAACAGAAYAAPTWFAYQRGRTSLRIARHVAGERLALTFDDGPHPVGTIRVLAQLQQLGIRATFFLVGRDVEQHPDVACAVRDAGHEIANHGYVHRNHFWCSPFDIHRDIERGADVIARVTGVRPTLYRPPQGAVSAATIRAAQRGDWPIVTWSTWGRDWRAAATAGSIAKDVRERMAAGAIMLLHDSDRYSAPASWVETVAALPRILEQARRRKLPVGPIGGRSELRP